MAKDEILEDDDEQIYFFDKYLIGRLEDAISLINGGKHHMAVASLLADISLLKGPNNPRNP